MTELYEELAEWAVSRREIERHGDRLLFRAQQQMSFADMLMALNTAVVAADEYPRRELEDMLIAIRNRLAHYSRAAALTPTEADYRAGAVSTPVEGGTPWNE